jgi:WD40 repeat protein
MQYGELVRFLQGHATPIECVAFHPSGELLASGSWDGSVRVWNVHTGQTVHILNAHSSGLEMVTFSPDGALLASSACDNTVCLWDTQSGRLLHKLEGHTSWVRCVAFSPDGTLLASGSDDGTVKAWDVTPAGAGRCLQTTAMEDPYTGMNISGATGITDAQKMALKALGAVER